MTEARVAELVAHVQQGLQAKQQLAEGGDRRLQRVVAAGLAAQHELVAAHMHLVPSPARSFCRTVGRGWLPDLMQQGWLGLRRATEGFDPARGARFSGYAHYWIFQSMQHFLNQHRRVVRVPHNVVLELFRLRRARARVNARQGRLGAAERAALASEIGTTEQRVGWLENIEREPQSLDALALDAARGPGTDAADAVSPDPADENQPGPFAAAMDTELREQLERVLGTLSFRQREVVKLRFGIGDGYTYTLEEVGRIFRLTHERIRQIEEKAIGLLRTGRHARILAAFLPEDRTVVRCSDLDRPEPGVAPHPTREPGVPLQPLPVCTAPT